jgi:hypothetical protein
MSARQNRADSRPLLRYCGAVRRIDQVPEPTGRRYGPYFLIRLSSGPRHRSRRFSYDRRRQRADSSAHPPDVVQGQIPQRPDGAGWSGRPGPRHFLAGHGNASCSQGVGVCPAADPSRAAAGGVWVRRSRQGATPQARSGRGGTPGGEAAGLPWFFRPSLSGDHSQGPDARAPAGRPMS